MNLPPTRFSLMLIAGLAVGSCHPSLAHAQESKAEVATKLDQAKSEDTRETAAAAEKVAAPKPPSDASPAKLPPAEAKPAASKDPDGQAADSLHPEKKSGREDQGKSSAKPNKPAKRDDGSEKKPLPKIGSVATPQIPGQPWRIHDIKRPRPKMVKPGVVDSAPPADARILFDGKDLGEWYHPGNAEEDVAYEPRWKVVDGYFEIEPHTGSILTVDSFASCQFHIEWMIPEGTTGTSQGRGNSGIKFMERYEVQILDSHNNRTYADGQAAAIYGQYPPMVNATREQGQWQSYDIIFEAPSYAEGKQVQPPVVTVLHNGILVHHRRQLTGPTGLRGASNEVVPPAAPIMLQDHNNRIRFRNIWIRDLP
jgi:hypothetical protein